MICSHLWIQVEAGKRKNYKKRQILWWLVEWKPWAKKGVSMTLYIHQLKRPKYCLRLKSKSTGTHRINSLNQLVVPLLIWYSLRKVLEKNLKQGGIRNWWIMCRRGIRWYLRVRRLVGRLRAHITKNYSINSIFLKTSKKSS